MVGLIDEMRVFNVFLCVCVCGVGEGSENFENQECRKSHLRSFCNAIKVLRLPEFSIFVDVSEMKVTINFMHLNVFEYKTEVFLSVYI